jgi:hypothetical protein
MEGWENTSLDLFVNLLQSARARGLIMHGSLAGARLDINTSSSRTNKLLCRQLEQ